MSKHESKLQSTGLLAGVFALMCLPCLLAPLLISVGLSSILVFLGDWFNPVLFGLVGVSLIGFFISLRKHGNPFPLLLALSATGLFIYSRFLSSNPYNQTPNYIGTLFILSAVAADWYSRHHYEKNTCKVCVPGTYKRGK